MAFDRPWYKRGGKEVVMACLGMPDSDHKWAYSALIDLMNDLDRPVPDDPQWICSHIGLTKQKWRKVREYLIDDGKLIVSGDYLTNPRFERELSEREDSRAHAREAGRRGGLAKAENARQQADLPLVDKTAEPVENNVGKTKTSKKLGKNLEKSSEKVGKNMNGFSDQTLKTKDKSLAPRAGARGERKERYDSSITTAPRARAREESANSSGRSFDSLDDLVWECVDAAGMHLRVKRKPDLYEQQRDIVSNWVAMGVDVRKHVIPMIGRLTAKEGQEPTGTLSRFSNFVESDHLQRKAKRD